MVKLLTSTVRIKALPAPGFINFFFAQQDLAAIPRFPVGIVSSVAANNTYGVKLGYIIGPRQEVRNLTEGHSRIIHVQSGYDHPDSFERQLIANLGQLVVKELGLINC